MKSRSFRLAWSLVCGAVVLAALVGILASSQTTLAGKPEKPPGKDKDDGGLNYDLARIHFAASSRIQWDGVASCTDPTGGADPIHYWDQHDTTLTDQNPDVLLQDGVETSVSGGGRLFFFTMGRSGGLYVQPDRWLVLDFRAPYAEGELPYDPDGDGNPDPPNIWGKVYPGTSFAPPDDEFQDAYIDNVKCTIKLDVMFKKNATRQPLSLSVRRATPEGYWEPAGWSLHSVKDLYIVEVDKNVRTLTTINPDTGQSDADEFELWNEGVVVGRYRIPLTWTMRLVDAP